MRHADELAGRVNALVAHPELSKHAPVADGELKKTEHTTPMPECMVPGWGVNPPKADSRDESFAKGRSSTPQPARSVSRDRPQQCKGADELATTAPSAALEAAAARAATAASRWDDSQRGAASSSTASTRPMAPTTGVESSPVWPQQPAGSGWSGTWAAGKWRSWGQWGQHASWDTSGAVWGGRDGAHHEGRTIGEPQPAWSAEWKMQAQPADGTQQEGPREQQTPAPTTSSSDQSAESNWTSWGGQRWQPGSWRGW